MRGGAPGTRETDLLDPGMLVEHVDALAFSGGSAFGLDTASGVTDWTLHDLRRTAASGMARLGVSLVVIEKILNHVSGSLAGIVGVYQRHEFADEKRQALQQWADYVERLVSERAIRIGEARQ